MKSYKELQEERKKFLFTILGIKLLRYNGKRDTIEFGGPALRKDGKTPFIYNPISLLVFKRRLIREWNKKQDLDPEKQIKSIPQVKIKVVGTGEEKWI